MLFTLSGAMTGKGKIVRFLLAGRFWVPWARLSFMVYLIHVLILYWFLGNTENAAYLSHIGVFELLASLIVLSNILAIPASLVFEAPFLNLEKTYMMAKKKP